MARRYLWLIVAVVVGLFTAAMFTRDGGPPVWTHLLLAPGLVGYALAGGVHGDASEWLLTVATAAVAGLFWGGVAQLVAHLMDAARQRVRARRPRRA